MSKRSHHVAVTPEQVLEACGGASAIAQALGINRSAPWLWAHPPKGREAQIPAGRVLELERLSGFSRHQIRPDLYGSIPEEPTAKTPDAA